MSSRPSSFYFFVLPIESGGYQHNLISLAQGLREMGLEFYASADYWRLEDGTYLFRHDPQVQAKDFEVVVISEQYLTYGEGKLPEAFLQAPGKKVLVHTGDGLGHQYNLGRLKAYYQQFDRVLMHFYRGVNYPATFHPWAYGISQHILDLARPDLEKGPRICLNYRNSHSVRRLASERIFDPLGPDALDTTREMDDWQSWKDTSDYARFCVYQSAGRHSLGYNQRIGSNQGTACFGGVFFIRPWFWNWPAFKVANYFVQSAASVGRMQTIATRLGLAKRHTYRIYQWDSWRFWETFANGSVAIHVDLERYGIILPEMPENGRHYLGVDLQKPEQALQVLRDEAQMREIGAAGRSWALAHYGPLAQADRFLELLQLRAEKSPMQRG